jgi:hypothetical protein
MSIAATDAVKPITEAIVYELDLERRVWLATPDTACLPPRLRVLCEWWRSAHPSCRFAMLLTLGHAQYSLRYFPDLAALASAIDTTNELVTGIGATVPWRLEILPASKAALAALLPRREPPSSAPGTH